MPNNPLGLLQEALVLSEQLLPLELRLRQAKKEGLIKSDYIGHQIDEAARAGVINAKETAQLRDYHDKVSYLLSVDDFAADELSRTGANAETPAAVAVTPTASTTAGNSTKKKVGKKKTASKKAAAKKTSKKKK
jgi:acyl-CoA dehydrogenase